jgi:hypothetical protein
MNNEVMDIEYKTAILLSLCSAEEYLTASQIVNKISCRELRKPFFIKKLLDELIEANIVKSFMDNVIYPQKRNNKTHQVVYCLCTEDADLMDYLYKLQMRQIIKKSTKAQKR